MALLVETTINGQHAAYTFQVHWNEDAFVEGHVAFEVHAIRTSKEGEPRTVKAVVMLENKDPQSPDLVIIIAGEVVFRDSLSNLTGENLVLDSIPGAAFAFGDPILGCFIRAGISAAVSQILACRDHTSGQGWGKSRLVAIGRCLWENGVRISTYALWRAGRCIASG